MKSGRLEIVPEEAEVVRMIFRDYLDGMDREMISKKLNKMKIPPMTSEQWWPSVIAAMLKNECYVGDLWCCTIKVDIRNSKSQYIEKEKQEATKGSSESTKIQHGI